MASATTPTASDAASMTLSAMRGETSTVILTTGTGSPASELRYHVIPMTSRASADAVVFVILWFSYSTFVDNGE